MFKQCPLKYKKKVIDKLPDPSGPAAERGTHIHKLAEGYVNGHIKGLPKELAKYKDEFKTLRALKRKEPDHVLTEFDCSMTPEWTHTSYDDWNGVYVRAYIDLLRLGENTAIYIDYKTGKKYPDHKDQGHLYATTVFCLDESIESVSGEFWYLDSGDLMTFEYERSALQRMIDVWERRVEKIKNEKHFDAMPGPLCKWCNYHVSKGGDCRGRD